MREGGFANLSQQLWEEAMRTGHQDERGDVIALTCDAVVALAALAPGSVAAVVCDPPYCSGGNTEAARKVVAAAPPPLYILSARAVLGLVAALRGEADAAGEQYLFLQQYRGIVLPGVLRSVDRLLGLLPPQEWPKTATRSSPR